MDFRFRFELYSRIFSLDRKIPFHHHLLSPVVDPYGKITIYEEKAITPVWKKTVAPMDRKRLIRNVNNPTILPDYVAYEIIDNFIKYDLSNSLDTVLLFINQREDYQFMSLSVESLLKHSIEKNKVEEIMIPIFRKRMNEKFTKRLLYIINDKHFDYGPIKEEVNEEWLVWCRRVQNDNPEFFKYVKDKCK